MEFFRGFFAASSSAVRNPIPENFKKYNSGIYGFDSPSHPRKAEIIFFHDIYWKGCEESPVESWMSNPESNSEGSVCWPQAWLSAKYNARILFANYDAGVRKTATEGLMNMFVIAENLRQDICSEYDEDCPIFLVGHGLGGLVIKKLVRSMQEKLSQLERRISISNGSAESKDLLRLRSFLMNLKGVFYFNTPVLGSRLVDSTNYSRDRGALLKYLEVLRSDISELNDWFRVWRRCKTTAIWAAHPTKVPLWHGHWCNHVVEEAAARSDVDNFYTVATDHFSVCKLSGQADSRLQRLSELIDPEILAADNDESACVKLVNDILSKLQTLGQGQGLHIIRDNKDNIRKFPKLWRKLEDGLRDAGLAKTDEDADLESWQPMEVCD